MGMLFEKLKKCVAMRENGEHTYKSMACEDEVKIDAVLGGNTESTYGGSTRSAFSIS